VQKVELVVESMHTELELERAPAWKVEQADNSTNPQDCLRVVEGSVVTLVVTVVVIVIVAVEAEVEVGIEVSVAAVVVGNKLEILENRWMCNNTRLSPQRTFEQSKRHEYQYCYSSLSME
jgi:hypothetical protein